MWLNPLMLSGLIVIAIPVVIHLAMRTRPRQMMFPALRFVRESRRASAGMLRLKQLVLLALRAAALALLVVILARPVSRQHVAAAPESLEKLPAAVVLCFDNSPSMGYRDQGYTRLEAARRLAQQIIERMPGRSRFAVLDLATAGKVRLADLDGPTAARAVESVELCNLTSSVAGMLRTAEGLLGSAGEDRREVYLFTDMARAAWAGIEEGAFDGLAGAAVYALDVGVEENLNLSLGEPALSPPAASRNATVEISDAVQGGARPAARTVGLEVGGELRGRRPVELTTPWESQSVSFAETLVEEGLVQGRLLLLEGDPLEADNVRYFTIHVGPPPAVAVVRKEERPARITDDAYLVTMALAPEELRRKGQTAVEPVLTPSSSLGKRSLGALQAVFLADAAGISAQGWSALEQFVSQGGGVVVLLGADVAAELAAGGETGYRSAAARKLLGAELGAVREPPGGTHFDPNGYEDPSLAAFDGGHTADLRRPTVFRCVDMQPTEDGREVLGFRSGGAALVAARHGGGSVFTLATAPQPGWSNLAARPDEFVVLLHSLLAAARHERTTREGYVIGQPVTFSFPRECAGRTATLTGPGLATAETRPIHPTTAAATLPALFQPGNYRLSVAMPAGAQLYGFSLNADPEESDLTRRSEASLTPLFGEGMMHVARDLDGLARAEILVRRGRELTGYLIPILLVVMVLELLLANRFHRRPASQGPLAEPPVSGRQGG